MFYLNWYPLQCCYSPRYYLQYLLHCYSLVVVAVVVVVVTVVVVVVIVVAVVADVVVVAVVVADVVVVVVVVAVGVVATGVVDFVWQFCRNLDCSRSDCRSIVGSYSSSLVVF